jgi:hypothetical protein
MHQGEHRHLVTEQLLVEQRAIALDVAGLLQRAHPPQAGRRRNTDSPRQLHIGDAAVVLQLFENPAVDGVETGSHKRLRRLVLRDY